MKKIFLYMMLGAAAITSCKDDDDDSTELVAVDTRNSYDDQAAQKFLQTHYLDERGNIQSFDDDDETDDNYTKLSDMNPVTLPSGVIYVVRQGAQPENGTTIGSTDILKLMTNTMTYVATETDGVVEFSSGYTFENTISSTGVPAEDPEYYYTPDSFITEYNEDNETSYDHSYFEIEGFREALQHFQAFDIPDEDDYNLQGVIIVPSRAAFARDSHYNYIGIALTDRSFGFNFQVYKSTPRD